jgi:hypothetical protein
MYPLPNERTVQRDHDCAVHQSDHDPGPEITLLLRLVGVAHDLSTHWLLMLNIGELRRGKQML